MTADRTFRAHAPETGGAPQTMETLDILRELREQYAGHTSGAVLDELRIRFRRAGIDASPAEMERLANDIARAGL